MRILFILHQFYPEFTGGTERVALNLARCAQHAGHHVRVLACTVDPAASGGKQSTELVGALETIHLGVPVMFLPRSLLPITSDYSFEIDLGMAERIETWMRHECFDIVHVLHPMRMGTALLAVQRCGLPYIITLTDFYSACFRVNLLNVRNKLCSGPQGGERCTKDCLVTPWTRDSLVGRQKQAWNLLASAGARVCPSDFVAEFYRNTYPELDFIVIRHGIDLLNLPVNISPTASTETNSFNLTFGFIGSIIPQKGLDTLLRAFACVAYDWLKLRVVGGFYGNPEYQNEVSQLAKADLRVEMAGQVPPQKVFEFIRKIDVLCLPSRVPETFSMALHEAAALGVPALVSNLGAPADYVAKFGSGCILPIDDVTAWACALKDIAEHPEVLSAWRSGLPVPLRVEEEAFFYESLYRQLLYHT